MDNTKRFSNRVEDYARYRPNYPKEVVAHLNKHYGLTCNKIVADVGAGTGISSQLFLDEGCVVHGVEPNKEMREKAIDLLKHYEKFQAVDGSAEHTNLKSETIDIVVAGQAFHWFDRPKTKMEFKRVLTKNGIVVLMWNERKVWTEFEKRYEELILKYAKDYVKVDHRNIDATGIAEFFSPATMEVSTFSNQQVFDFEGLKGRLLSSSYVPAEGEQSYEQMLAALKNLFDQYQHLNEVKVNYDVNVYVSRL